MANIGIIGLGTVGLGTYKVLSLNEKLLEQRVGIPIHVAKLCTKNPDKDRGVDFSVDITTDPIALAQDPNVDIVVELMGGLEKAKEAILTAIDHGKHVVTANKDLLARHGNEIFSAAKNTGVYVGFEAAVAGGIPIIKTIQDGLSGNDIEWIAGIINGTANFILTKMMHEGWTFTKALQEAQALGYAEADPSFDVGGVDAAHKITILASIAFNIPFQFSQVVRESIESITPIDVEFAKELGYQFKQIAIAKKYPDHIECRVHPCLIPKDSLLASVNGVMNAVAVQANAVGPTLYYGAGAGGFATASAVVADIVEIAKALKYQTKAPQLTLSNTTPICSESEGVGAFYVRLQSKDQAGSLAKIMQLFADEGISVEVLLQKPSSDNLAPICLITHSVQKRYLQNALAKVEQLRCIQGASKVFHVERMDIGERA